MGERELEKIPIPARTLDVITGVAFHVGEAQYTEDSAVAVFVVTGARLPDLSRFKGRTFAAVMVFSPKNHTSILYVSCACALCLMPQGFQARVPNPPPVDIRLH